MDAAAAGTLYDQAGSLDNLAYCLFVLGEYSDGIAAAQRALRKLLEQEATVESQTDAVSESLLTIGSALCGTGEADMGVKLVSAARRMNRENGVAEWALGRLVLDGIETNARAALGDEGYEAAARRGEALTREEAIELALDVSAG